MKSSNKFDRQIAFFGKEGQEIIERTKVSIVGTGGIGSHVAQHLAFLGINSFTIMDKDKLEETNKNRLIGLQETDQIDVPKVDIVERLIKQINSSAVVNSIKDSFISELGFEALKKSDIIFGCVDNDGPRLVMNEFCSAYEIPYIDIATEIDSESPEYGGRIISIFNGNQCLFCLDEISGEEVQEYFESPEEAVDRRKIYGMSPDHLGESGPSVVTLNGIVASVAVTEFMVQITGIRNAIPFLKYVGTRGLLVRNTDEPKNGCYYCKSVRGKGENIDFKKYLN